MAKLILTDREKRNIKDDICKMLDYKQDCISYTEIIAALLEMHAEYPISPCISTASIIRYAAIALKELGVADEDLIDN